MIKRIVCSVCDLALLFADDDYVINRFRALCEECFKKEGQR